MQAPLLEEVPPGRVDASYLKPPESPKAQRGFPHGWFEKKRVWRGEPSLTMMQFFSRYPVGLGGRTICVSQDFPFQAKRYTHFDQIKKDLGRKWYIWHKNNPAFPHATNPQL